METRIWQEDDTARAVLHFDRFLFDVATGMLLDGDRAWALRPKTAAVLAHLLRHAGEVVPRGALLDAVWPDVTVTDDSLTQCICDIRRALGRGGAALLRTLPRRGYILCAMPWQERPPAVPRPLRKTLWGRLRGAFLAGTAPAGPDCDGQPPTGDNDQAEQKVAWRRLA